ncbi:hypothetical protein SAMN05216556_1433 [Aequorivita viscosa]|uniref:PEP-CTERM protein-sorting domain-containing protein n=2 Tax=Aequorivita viscosa TaxID=797419 RepID=A0A1M6PEM4_9FLAO|nr:hypothetical protein SAMN05216556_1433 [Aequorivita viscosa]SHK06342.1 hypothetical protein SAMN04487908_1474 [Aequorivita viscosa]
MKTKTNSMKTNNRTTNKKVMLLLTGLLLVGSLTANAQIGLPGGDPNIPDAPIDGFLSIGLIAGACIGLRKRIKGLKE